MRAHAIEAALLIAAGVCLVATVVAWRGASVAARPAGGPIAEATDTLTTVDAARIAADNETVVAKDLFRAARKPSPVPFAPAVAGGAQLAHPPRLPRPQLAVSGIIGPPWEAVLEGVPGRDGAVVVRSGDVLGDLKVTRVKRDTVLMQGSDTTWRLTVRRAW